MVIPVENQDMPAVTEKPGIFCPKNALPFSLGVLA
jgi:hypothetical protein